MTTNKNVAQPPSAGGTGVGRAAQPRAAVLHEKAVPHENIVAQPPSAGRKLAKSAKTEYRRNLPHIQVEECAIFVTFCTWKRWIFPESVRMRVLEHCIYDHGRKTWLHGAIVMPDHVHLVFTPLCDSQGGTFGLAEIMHGIKGASAHSINRLLKRKGHVWQDESFDHILRCDESIEAKVEYICQNPVRQRLVTHADDYLWLWREGGH